MRRALVTGATGGLGLGLTRLLIAEGYQVRATGRDGEAAARLRALGADVALADLVVDPAAAERLCQDIDVVFHAAALSSPWGPSTAFERINVSATRRLLDAARMGGCEGMVFVSSPSIYAELRDRIGLTERDPPAARPLNAYARTKLAAERLVLAANRPDFFTVAVRPRALVGPDDKVLLPRLLKLVAKGRLPLPRGGRALVELTDTRDAAWALLLADRARETVGGQAFNVSGGRPVSVGTLAHALAEALGQPLTLIPAPWPVMLAGAGALEGLAAMSPGRPEPLMTAYGVATLAFSQTFDLDGAAGGLGYAPRHDPLAAALDLTRGGREGSV